MTHTPAPIPDQVLQNLLALPAHLTLDPEALKKAHLLALDCMKRSLSVRREGQHGHGANGADHAKEGSGAGQMQVHKTRQKKDEDEDEDEDGSSWVLLGHPADLENGSDEDDRATPDAESVWLGLLQHPLLGLSVHALLESAVHDLILACGPMLTPAAGAAALFWLRRWEDGLLALAQLPTRDLERVPPGLQNTASIALVHLCEQAEVQWSAFDGLLLCDAIWQCVKKRVQEALDENQSTFDPLLAHVWRLRHKTAIRSRGRAPPKPKQGDRSRKSGRPEKAWRMA